MNNKTAGRILGLAALGMMFGLMAADVKQLATWHEAVRPIFVGNMMLHLSVVIMSFVGGKLIPTEPQNQRKDDN